MKKTLSFAAKSSESKLEPFTIERRTLRDNDVKIDIKYCGICHSDLHFVKNDWGFTKYPVVPGHEIVGTVTEVGKNVKKFKVQDIVGVGCLVGSCGHCLSCEENLEQFCENGFVPTYGGKDPIDGTTTFGGYSENIVVNEDFVLSIPENLDLKGAAPLLCAGITLWSPLNQWKVKKGDLVGIIGLGGLGHMGVKLAHAMGAKVVMITTSEQKGKDAQALGADEVLISTNLEDMQKYNSKFDLLINTIPVRHQMDPYVALLKRDATMVLVGAIEPLDPVHGAQLIFKRRRIAGSLIGGIKETQEMLDFCGKHNIVSDIEVINIQDINTAYERMLKNDVKYRFVIDMASLKD